MLAEANDLLASDRRTSVYRLETGSVYGSSIAFPQLARCSGYNKVFVFLWLRAWMGLALNFFLQMQMVVFVGEATQIMSPLGGMMHLCDFGAKLDSCKGPDGDFDPGCVGPGGTQFAPPRLYGYTQWAVQKFTKQALLDVLPDKEEEINAHVDPGEYGLENEMCRWICVFLFTVSAMQEVQTCFRMFTLLWSTPHTAEMSRVEGMRWKWITFDRHGKANYQIGGIPIYWKAIIMIVVLLPKIALCHYVLLEGTLLLMDTSGILDTVLGALSLQFVLYIDEMLYDTMHTPAAKSIMQKLEESLQKQEEALEELEKKQEEKEQGHSIPKEVAWSDSSLLRQIFPLRLMMALVVMFIYVTRYYQFKCKWSDSWGLWVSKDMYLPERATYSMGDFVLNGLYHTIPHQEKPFWTMPVRGE